MPSTYVYCIVKSTRPPRTARVPPGLPGTRGVRAVEVGAGLFAIVADAPEARYSEAAVNARLSDLNWVSKVAVGHEAVVEHFIDAAAVLPMKLFTMFADDDRMRAHISSERSRLLAMAKRVGGHHEWGVRVLLDGTKRIARTAGTTKRRTAALTGSDYLSRKKAARDASIELASRAHETVDDLYDRLARRAKLSRRRSAAELPAQGGSLLLDAAFLVSRTRTSSFRAAVVERARALAPQGYAVTLTGPWPPYTFVKD
jgi:hypothetical protein